MNHDRDPPTDPSLRRSFPAAELTPERPKKRIRLLGEDLVIYRESGPSDSSIPSYGCVAENCAHRGCSLYYGFLEDGGVPD